MLVLLLCRAHAATLPQHCMGMQGCMPQMCGAGYQCQFLHASMGSAASVNRVPPEQATEVRLVMEGAACAAVALAAAGQPEGVRVALRSPEEATSLDAWECSAHQVFRWAPASLLSSCRDIQHDPQGCQYFRRQALWRPRSCDAWA